MNPLLRDRVLRHLEPLPDERVYQVLDYIEFLESRYGQATAAPATLFQRFTEGIEDTLRAGRVSTAAITETVGLLNRAAQVLGGAAAAGKSVASDFVGAVSRATGTGPATSVPAPAPPAPDATPPASAEPDGTPAAKPAPPGDDA